MARPALGPPGLGWGRGPGRRWRGDAPDGLPAPGPRLALRPGCRSSDAPTAPRPLTANPASRIRTAPGTTNAASRVRRAAQPSDDAPATPGRDDKGG